MMFGSKRKVLAVILAGVVVLGAAGTAIPRLFAAATANSVIPIEGGGGTGVQESIEFDALQKLVVDLQGRKNNLVEARNVRGRTREVALRYVERANQMRNRADEFTFHLATLKADNPERETLKAQIDMARKYEVESEAEYVILVDALEKVEELERSIRVVQDARDQARIRLVLRLSQK